MRAAGGNGEFTIYPEAAHDSWAKTYANPKLSERMMARRNPDFQL